MPRSPARAWLRLLLSVAAAAFGIAASMFLYYQAYREEEGRVETTARQRAYAQALDLQARIEDQFDVLSSLTALLAGGGVPSGATFEQFVRAQASRDPQVARVVSWVPQVKGEDRASFEVDAALLTGNPDYAIRDLDPAGHPVASPSRPVHYPILFSVTFDGQAPPPGFDAASTEFTRQGIEAVRDLGVMRSGGLGQRRVVTDGPVPVIIVTAPLYRGSLVPGTTEERRQRFLGVSFGVFGLEPLIATAIRNAPQPVNATLYLAERPFGSDRKDQGFAVFRPATGKVSIGAIDPAPEEDGEKTIAETIQVAGRAWSLLFRFSPSALADVRSNEPILRLALGLLVTLMAVIYIRTAQRSVANLRLRVDVAGRQLTASHAELAELNARLATVIDSSPVAIVALDGDGLVTSWNAAATAILGVAAADTVGRHPSVVGDAHVDAFDSMIGRARAGETLQGVAVKGRRNDGTEVDLLLSAAPLGGGGKGVLLVLMDVSERHRMERQLHQAQKMEAVGQLTGGLAHDFNNLLAVIIGNLDILSERLGDDPELLKLIEIPLEAALKGADLNRALLAFSRRQTLEPKRVEVATVMKDMAKLLRRTLGENIVIDVRDVESAWPVVIDPAQLESAILNLAVNARDAMPNGGRLSFAASDITVDEELARKIADLSEGEYVRLSVTDTGTGMTPEILARAFEPFFTTKEIGRGSGLGLAQVFGFAKQSGGTVRIYSEVGHGTTISLYLPRAKTDATGSKLPERHVAETVGRGETVLVVEDNPQLRDIVEMQLGELGFRTVTVPGTKEALEVLRGDRKVDLLFTDIVMPGAIDGRRLASEARELRPRLKVLFTSGFANAGLADGPDLPGRLLSKPYRKHDLAARVRETLDA